MNLNILEKLYRSCNVWNGIPRFVPLNNEVTSEVMFFKEARNVRELSHATPEFDLGTTTTRRSGTPSLACTNMMCLAASVNPSILNPFTIRFPGLSVIPAVPSGNESSKLTKSDSGSEPVSHARKAPTRDCTSPSLSAHDAA